MLPVTNSINHHSYAIDTLTRQSPDTLHSASIPTVKPEELLNHEFELIQVIIEGQQIELANRETNPLIKFTPGLAHKNLFFPDIKENDLFLSADVDNRFFGPLSYENGILKARKLITTHLSQRDNLENTITNAFREGVTVSLQEKNLILQSSTAELIYTQL